MPYLTLGGSEALSPVFCSIATHAPTFHEWDDLFDAGGDPRGFDQVVKRKHLTVPQLVKAGVAAGVARKALGL